MRIIQKITPVILEAPTKHALMDELYLRFNASWSCGFSSGCEYRGYTNFHSIYSLDREKFLIGIHFEKHNRKAKIVGKAKSAKFPTLKTTKRVEVKKKVWRAAVHKIPTSLVSKFKQNKWSFDFSVKTS